MNKKERELSEKEVQEVVEKLDIEQELLKETKIIFSGVIKTKR